MIFKHVKKVEEKDTIKYLENIVINKETLKKINKEKARLVSKRAFLVS